MNCSKVAIRKIHSSQKKKRKEKNSTTANSAVVYEKDRKKMTFYQVQTKKNHTEKKFQINIHRTPRFFLFQDQSTRIASSIFLHNNLYRIRFRQYRNHIYQQQFCNKSKKHILTNEGIACNKSFVTTRQQLNHHYKYITNISRHKQKYSNNNLATTRQPTKSNNEPSSSTIFVPRIFVTNMLDSIWFRIQINQFHNMTIIAYARAVKTI